jgi:excisionase family DNA binding protein
MRIEDLPLLLTPDQALELRLVPVGRSSLYRAIARGDIRTVRIGRRVLIPRAALAEFCGEED